MPTLPRVPPSATTAVALALAVTVTAPTLAADLERASVGPRGVQADGVFSGHAAISPDGRFVTFTSYASNLAPGDTNGHPDVFVRDRVAGRTERVSLGPGGRQGDDASFAGAVSADGRFVAFHSEAGNLVPGDTDRTNDVFVRDRRTGRTTRESVAPDGGPPAGSSGDATLSADGRFVAFVSSAANLVPGDTNGEPDVFVRDRRTGTTRRASVGPGGRQGDDASTHPAISADGRFVAFHSAAGNLVAGDTNGTTDTFVHDLRTGRTTRASVGTGGVQADSFSFDYLAISATGRYVAFASFAANLVPGDTNRDADVFVRDLRTGTTTRASVGSGGVQSAGGSDGSPAISANGRLVAFVSRAADLVPGDTNEAADVFVHNRRTGATRRSSAGPGGAQADGASHAPALSTDGRVLAFQSDAANLVPDDTNGVTDVFVLDRR